MTEMARASGAWPRLPERFGQRLSGTAPVLWCVVATSGLGTLVAFDAERSTMLVLACGLIALLLASPLLAIGFLLATGGVDLAASMGGDKLLVAPAAGVDLNGIRLLTSVLGMSVLVVVQRAGVRRVPWRYAVGFGVFLAYAACTIVWSPARLDGLRLLVKVAYPVLLFVSILTVAKSQRDVNRLLAAALGAGLVVAVVVNPILWLNGSFDTDSAGITRLKGGGFHENPAAFYMLALLILTLARFRSDRAWLWVGFAAAFSVSLVLTYTRSAILSLVPALLVMEFVGARRRRGLGTRRLLALMTLGVVLASTLPILATRSYVSADAVNTALDSGQVQNPVEFLSLFNLQGRDLAWNLALDQFQQSPVFGVGLGGTVARLQIDLPSVAAPHNEYLRFLAETGIVGTALLIACLAGWWKAATHVLTASPSPEQADLARAALGALTVLMVTAASDNMFDYYGPFTQFLALYVAGALVPLGATRIAIQRTGRRPWLIQRAS